MHPENPHLPFLLFLAVGALAAGEAAAGTTLTASPAKLSPSDQEIKIRWSGLPDPDGLDYVAIYSPPSSRDRDFLGYLFLNGSASWREGHGELSLPRLPTLRAPYQFRLFRWPANEYSYHHIDHDRNPLPHGKHRVAVSGEVSVGDPASPEQVHLAFADAVDEMRVMFLCGDGGKRVVRYGLQKDDEKGWKEVGTEVRTYEQKHMCDGPANSSVAWRDPGFVFDGLMKGLEPGRRYFYKVGSDTGGWSETYSFISRDSEANETNAFLFGDMGTYVPYNTYIRTQAESMSTVKWILRDIEALGDKPAFISHIGDISYARGYSWVWDHFFSQIEPIAANTPYHVCIGNHEYDWPSQPWKPSWATYGKDGGGECGIPYSVKFRMPGNSVLPTGNGGPDTRNLYYSFDSGVVHFVYMSTETNFLQGSDQYNFLKADLEKVNRTRTPFVVFQGHRPMYTTSDETRDAALKQQMLQNLEPLLVTYNVTLALWGHVHRYERFCPMKNFQCVNTSSSFQYSGAPVHLVIGMGGQDWQPIWQPRPDHPDVPIFPQPERSMYRGGVFGYTRLVATREKLTLTYVGNHDGQVHDMVEIFSGQVSSNSSVAEAVDGTKLSTGVSNMRKIPPLYLEIGGSVMFALLLGFGFGFLVRRKKEAAQWTPVKNEES
ncbi:putative inactive purple acid phosphatase 2 [Panicum miliaceum]|uniref:Purple acid phosphatase n=1 Tax=Panicum miliaceum TaxID=4540 RepID=A0A3L6T8K7_PANMI|nr:putative inactive purple acid phosphatase 2 [Panicum miliaceum]